MVAEFIQAEVKAMKAASSSPFTEFQSRIKKVFVEGSGIDPVFTNILNFHSDIEISAGMDAETPIHEGMGWDASKIKRFRHQVTEDTYVTLLENEDGSVWQGIIADDSDRGYRYQAPSKAGDKPYLPPIPDKIRLAISKRYQVEVPFDDSFWDWLRENKQIPITFTEGAKKSLSLLSQGFVAISLYGCSCGVLKNPSGNIVKDALQPYVENRICLVAFDRDSKPKTREKVHQHTHKLITALSNSGAFAGCLQWPLSWGKGLDDVIVKGHFAGLEKKIQKLTLEVAEKNGIALRHNVGETFAQQSFKALYGYGDEWICVGDNLYKWDKNHYKLIEDDAEIARISNWCNEFEKTIIKKDGSSLTLYPYASPKYVSEALNWAKSRLKTTKWDSSGLINCTNGVVKLNWTNNDVNWELIPHDSTKHFFLTEPKIPYLPDAFTGDCDRLLECLEPAHREIFLKTIAAAFDLKNVRRIRGRNIKALLLKGTGANGKDALRTAVSVIFRDVISLSFSDFQSYDQGRKFPVAALRDTRMSWCSENNNDVALDKLQALKCAITGSSLVSELKNKTGIEFTPLAVLLFNINDIPYINGSSDAIQTRFAIIQFLKSFKTHPKPGELQAGRQFSLKSSFHLVSTKVMKIEQIRLYQIKQKLPTLFKTSYGVNTHKNCILLSVHSQGLVGWGECVASGHPSYSYETVKTARHILEDFLIPIVMQCDLDTVDDLPDFNSIRGHFMAKAALENALWDLLAKSQDVSLSQIIGGVKTQVEIGSSIGIQEDISTLLAKVATRLDDGYKRIKIKIKPGWDIEPVRAIREDYPDIQLMVDANSAYTLADTPLFQKLDLFNLLMIEQPLAHDDIIDHAKLQEIINTPICLDESLYSVQQAQRAIDLQAGRIVNMKVGRVGGIRHALQIHDLMQEAGWQMWCGGMFETPIGRIVNLHLAAKANFTLANDINVYSLGNSWLKDESFVRNKQDSTVAVPTGAGIGVDINYETLVQHQIYQVNFEQTHYFSPQKTVVSTTKDEDNKSQQPNYLPNPSQPLPFRWFGAIHESFEQQVERVPEKLALVGQDITFTYQQLNELSNRIANYLLEHQLEGKLVGIYAAFSPFLVVALLGILKAGAAFMVLNKDYPVTQLLRYCQLGVPKALICLEMAGELPEALQEIAPAVQLHLPQQLHQAEEIFSQYSLTNPHRMITPEQLAYIVFTSGSTGIPNGIVGTHGPVTHFIEWQIRTFGLNEEDRFSNLASIAHDILLRDVFTPLSLGATLYVPPSLDESSISLDLGEWMGVNKISVAHLTPPRGQLLTITNQPLPDLRYLFFGGDKLPNSLVSQLQKLTVNLSCVNFYGTTETPQAMSYYILSPQKMTSAIAPIGQGIDDVQILLLDDNNQLVKIGEKGEIAVRTPYLCQGYLDNPILTQQRFITNPYTENPSDRIYKTGDLGRYLPKVGVEILGRRDNQVNIRGFRVELDELEGILLEYSFVKEAAVKLIEEGEKQYLVAYIVGQEGLDLSLLQVYANERLVSRIKLNIFVRLEAFPLTVNGKIDRHALPKPDFSQREYVPPQTETEFLLVSLWEDVLRENVGITDNFFELGGDSLMATYIVVKLAKLSDTHLLPTILFDYPTIEDLATHIDGLQTNIITLASNYITTSVTYAPATYAQERVMKWLESGTATLPYHLPSVYRLTGSLNVEALQQSFAYLVQRHEALRTRLLWKDSHLFQSIEPQMSINFLVEQLSDQRTLGDYINKFLYQTFDLTQEPPVKVALLQIAKDEHLLLIIFHHIMVDGRAKRLLFNELSILYRDLVLGKEPSLTPLSSQYVDYVYWQRHLPITLLEQHRAYWLPRLANITDSPVLPQDYPIPQVRTFKTEQSRQILPLPLSDGLKQLSQKEHTTLFMSYLSCFYLLLYRYSGKRQLTVVTPNTVRPAANFNGVVGDFTNYLLLQIELGEQPTTFRELLQKVRRITSDAYKYQYVPFEQLAREAYPQRDFLPHPLCRIQINMITWEQPFELYEIKSERHAHEESGYASSLVVNFFDLSFVIRTKLLPVADESEPKTHYMIQLKYQSQLFKKERINQFLADYQDIIKEIVANPDMAIVFPE